MPEEQALPPVCPPECRVLGIDRQLLTASRADNDPVIGLHRDYHPEFADFVGIVIAVACWINALGMGTGVDGTLLLAINHLVPGLENRWHAVLVPLSGSTNLQSRHHK